MKDEWISKLGHIISMNVAAITVVPCFSISEMEYPGSPKKETCFSLENQVHFQKNGYFIRETGTPFGK